MHIALVSAARDRDNEATEDTAKYVRSSVVPINLGYSLDGTKGPPSSWLAHAWRILSLASERRASRVVPDDPTAALVTLKFSMRF
jgi:hypothetical protein